MAQTDFRLDEGTAKEIEKLKKFFGVKTSTGVIRMAVALAKIAKRASARAKEVDIVNIKGQRTKITIRP